MYLQYFPAELILNCIEKGSFLCKYDQKLKCEFMQELTPSAKTFRCVLMVDQSHYQSSVKCNVFFWLLPCIFLRGLFRRLRKSHACPAQSLYCIGDKKNYDVARSYKIELDSKNKTEMFFTPIGFAINNYIHRHVFRPQRTHQCGSKKLSLLHQSVHLSELA